MKFDVMKYEVAQELGIPNYANIDKGQLTSRQNGYVGGRIVQRVFEDYKKGRA